MTITAGMTSSSFDVDIIDNMIQDGDKMFIITIRLISICLPVTINSDTTTVTIIDDEGTVRVDTFVSYTFAFFVHLVLRVQFASTTFSGLESSGEIFVSVVITGGIPSTTVSVAIIFTTLIATG